LTEFRIFETEQFHKDLRTRLGPRSMAVASKLPAYVYPQLRRQPYFGKNIRKLRGYRPETWRYRIGGCRFFYEIDDARRIVSMLAAEPRSKSYRS
jgi:mRNA interferase RelE/StbE